MTTRTTPARLAAVAIAALLAAGASACGTSGGEKADTATTAAPDKTTTTAAEDDPDDDATTTTTTEGEDDDVTTTAGGGSGGGDRDAYVDAIAEGMGIIFTEDADAATCMGEGWVDTIGLDTLTEAGLSPEAFGEADDEMIDTLDIDEDLASDLYDVFADCDIDLKALFLSFANDGESATAEQTACVEDLLTDDALRASFVAEYTGNELESDPLDEIEFCFEGTPDADD